MAGSVPGPGSCGAAAAAAAVAAPGAQPPLLASPTIAEPMTQERLTGLLAELREYHEASKRERKEFHREQIELQARKLKLQSELESEEQIGQDLLRRIRLLEGAIVRERDLGRSCSKDAAQSVGVQSEDLSEQGNGFHPILSMLTQEGSGLQDIPGQVQSCRDVLKSRLREAGVQLGQATLSREADLGGPSSPSMPSQSRPWRLQSPEPPLLGLWDSQREGAPLPTWNRSWTLSSHLDGARRVLCNSSSGLLASCGEDSLVKLWDLSLLWRGSTEDWEPLATFRGHAGAVLALALQPQEQLLFSAGMDRTIRAWQIPPKSFDPYGASAGALLQPAVTRSDCHGECIWDLQHHPQLPILASASADGSVTLWPAEVSALKKSAEKAVIRPGHLAATPRRKESRAGKADDVPTCVAWVPADAAKLVAGYTSSRLAFYDVKRGDQVVSLQSSVGAAVTSVSCDQIQLLVALGLTDGSARLVDVKSRKIVGILSEHTDVVTSVSIDPVKGHCLLTGCHDGFLRCFDLRNGKCSQQLRVAGAKYSEAVHSVCHSDCLIAAAEASGSITVFLP